MPNLTPPWTDDYPASRKPLAWLRYNLRSLRIRGLKLRDPRLTALHDKYRGRRCFIMGNGPSLMKRDLTALKDEITFGANALFKHFDELGFVPTFWCQVDISQAEDWADELNAARGFTKFVSLKNSFAYALSPEVITLNSKFTTRHDDPDDPGEPMFSKNAAAEVYHAQTVTYVALQLAYYMGFSEVYLIGVDHDYGILPELFPTGKPIITAENIELANKFHFAGNHYKIGDRLGIPKFHIIEAGYRLARKVFEADGRRLVNITDGGKLEIFERDSFDAVLARPAPTNTQVEGITA
ncbi:6-hydroxymethylpterin diphosphokinase MptE-like protein [Sphingomonas canadensis]|uniref:6-hydroxymethylpterin diphosphokinase MptE-like protein n=1 Tax=Sphingomonas canadensis TaxID=1219257 RepID=A0ABW3HC65_9SPHN|nr:6-hydroxymethylpterin diphosphokinase MptE-like protein [Sphingomonas canadensis]MCW3837119.1 DUF115 domain-containing protein [Sphingomonas canadensis]